MASLEKKSKVLVIGALEHLGKYIVKASVMLGHFTLVLLPSIRSADPAQNKIIEYFQNIGVAFIKGDINNHSRLVQAIRAVDVVISAAGGESMSFDLFVILAAIKDAGNITRFIPSGLAIDVDQTHVLPAAVMELESYRDMRQFIEQSGVPYTHIVGGFFAGEILGRLNSQQSRLSLPLKIPLYGDGNAKGSYTILAADDPRTLNKTLYIMPPQNVLSLNDLVSLWERKINRLCNRIYISEEAFMNLYNIEADPKAKIALAFIHSAFIRGDLANFSINPSFGVEASQLYPRVNYTTIDQYLNRLLLH